MAKITYYTFGPSVWAAAGELAIEELGYTDLEKKVVNLLEGENFTPEFIKLNPNATLPTLTAGGKTYGTTTDVVDYLVKNASKKVVPRTELTAIVHEDKYDPNFAFVLARSDEELKGKASGFPNVFITGRQAKLEKISATPEAAPHKAFYDAKLASNGGLAAIYSGKVDSSTKEGFFVHSTQHWANIKSFVLEMLPKALAGKGAFLGGDVPGEDDFHLGAWVARMTMVTGGKSEKDGIRSMEGELGELVPKDVVEYWNAWIERDSWKVVYKDGLH